MRIFWAYFAFQGSLILIPFLYYGRYCYKIAQTAGNTRLSCQLRILLIFLSMATPLVLVQFLSYTIWLYQIDSNPIIFTIYHLFINVSDNIIVNYIAYLIWNGTRSTTSSLDSSS